MINISKLGLDPQASCDAPRVRISASTGGPGDGTVTIEPGFSEELIEDLRSRGHNIVVVGDDRSSRGGFGRAQILIRTKDGVLWGGSEPRTDGCAMGF